MNDSTAASEESGDGDGDSGDGDGDSGDGDGDELPPVPEGYGYFPHLYLQNLFVEKLGLDGPPVPEELGLTVTVTGPGSSLGPSAASLASRASRAASAARYASLFGSQGRAPSEPAILPASTPLASAAST